MKKVLFLLAILAAFSFTTMQQKKKVVFFGDSITQAGVGPKGYITVIGEKLAAKGKKDQYELMGAGIGGNKVYDLYLRMEEDVLAKNPDVVVIWVGVNDVWHKRSFGTGTDPDKFVRFYEAIIKKLQAKNIKVYVCTPAAIGERTDFSNELDGDLQQYSKLIRTLATNNKCELIDLREAFLKYNVANNKENKESGILTNDRVHLNDKGNDFVADEMLKVVFK
ncbi:MAG: G-D-S-L family lipolytic protein [Chitinophagaceae bacterium]|nr:MAG: G-D-S-L family lipolytic protein [Chitinophagaceae bacterium]